MNDPAPAWLQTLMLWTSPAFPVGAFSYSHGLEWLVEVGTVHDRGSLEDCILALIDFGDLQADAAYLARSHDAPTGQLPDIAREAAAFRGSAELGAESCDQGRAFVQAAAGGARLAAVSGATGGRPPHAVAFGAAAADAGIPVAPTTEGWLHSAAANLVNAGQRLIPLGQRDGIAALEALKAPVRAASERAVATPLTEIAASGLAMDLASIRHETQYTRLFRS